MDEKNEKTRDATDENVTDEAMDEVAGGMPFFGYRKLTAPCAICGNDDDPVWSSFLNTYVCPNPECRVPRKYDTPDRLPII